MNFLRRRLYEDPLNIELRRYCLIESILNENWNDLEDILEETPYFHFHLIQFALKYIPSRSESSTSIESLEQSILFSSKAKLYQEWIQMGKGECEIIESDEIILRFWISKNHSINLVLLINLNQLSLSSINNSSFLIEFKAKNRCDYPILNSFISYQIQFYSLIDLIRFKEILSMFY